MKEVDLAPHLSLRIYAETVSDELTDIVTQAASSHKVRTGLLHCVPERWKIQCSLFCVGETFTDADASHLREATGAGTPYFLIVSSQMFARDFIRSALTSGLGRSDFLTLRSMEDLTSSEVQNRLEERLAEFLNKNQLRRTTGRVANKVVASEMVESALRSGEASLLDGTKVVEFFGISQPLLAKGLGMLKQQICHTPVSDVLQRRLPPFHWTAKLGMKAFESRMDFLMWLNTRNGDIATMMPLDLFTSENIGIVIGLLEERIRNGPRRAFTSVLNPDVRRI